MQTTEDKAVQKLAYSQKDAAALLGMSRITLWRKTKSREIYPMKGTGLYAHEELARFAREKTEDSKRTKRFPRTNWQQAEAAK